MPVLSLPINTCKKLEMQNGCTLQINAAARLEVDRKIKAIKQRTDNIKYLLNINVNGYNQYAYFYHK